MFLSDNTLENAMKQNNKKYNKCIPADFAINQHTVSITKAMQCEKCTCYRSKRSFVIKFLVYRTFMIRHWHTFCQLIYNFLKCRIRKGLSNIRKILYIFNVCLMFLSLRIGDFGIMGKRKIGYSFEQAKI